jgi:hypothetical protein
MHETINVSIKTAISQPIGPASAYATNSKGPARIKTNAVTAVAR